MRLCLSCSVPLEIQREILSHFGRILCRDVVAYCAQANGISTTLTQDGVWCTSVDFQVSPASFRGWAELVWEYHRLRSICSRPSFTSRFFETWSPYRLLHHVDITLTGLSGPSSDFTVKKVAKLGKTLALLPLHSITIRTRHINPFCNGIVLWPPQPQVTTVVVCFTRNCPTDEWKRPSFAHVFHPFPALVSFELQVCHPRRYFDITDAWEPHPAFEVRMRAKKYQEEGEDVKLYHPHEASETTLRRMGHNVSVLCPPLTQVSWQERRRNMGRWETQLVVCRRLLGQWDRIVTQIRDERNSIVAESRPYGDSFAAVESQLP